MAAELENLNDEQLLNLICNNDNSQAFSVLVKRHNRRFYYLAYRSLYNKEEAQDVVQDAFIKLWDNPKIWDAKKKAKFTTFFYKIIVNRCLDINKRQRKRHLEFKDSLAHNNELNQFETAEHKQKQDLLESAIQSLPAKQKMALNLCFYEGISNKEAAEIMGMKVKALESLLMRSKQSLRKVFKIDDV